MDLVWVKAYIMRCKFKPDVLNEQIRELFTIRQHVEMRTCPRQPDIMPKMSS
nr:MAG TPA: hypothetical protein [Caudoviricetes sp.]